MYQPTPITMQYSALITNIEQGMIEKYGDLFGIC